MGTQSSKSEWSFWAKYHRPRLDAAFRKASYHTSNPWYSWAKRSADNSNRRKRDDMTKSSGITTNVILNILEAQDFKCALSGIPLTPGTAQLDHIVPTRRGGSHEPNNVQVLFEDVNRAKSAMLEAEFVDMCRKVVEHADRDDK